MYVTKYPAFQDYLHSFAFIISKPRLVYNKHMLSDRIQYKENLQIGYYKQNATPDLCTITRMACLALGQEEGKQ